MEVKYCLIGKPAGSDKFVVIDHEPKNLPEASRLARISPEYPTTVMLARFEKVEETIDRLNKHGLDNNNNLPQLPPDDSSSIYYDPQEYLETAITTAITACKHGLLKRGLILNIKEIYIGAESNEVQVILDTKQVNDEGNNANDTNKP